MNDAAEQPERRWCAGLPEVDARRLTEEERVHVHLWFARARAWVRGYRAFLVSLVPIWIGVSVYFAVDDYRSGLEVSPLLVVLASLGVFLGASGVISGAAEIIIGVSRRLRWTFIVLGVLVAAAFISSVRDPTTTYLFGMSATVLVITGLIVMGIRIRRGQRTWRLLQRLDESVRDGVVIRFANKERALEVLVPVGVALRADGEPVQQPMLLSVDRLAGPVTPPPSAPLRAYVAVDPPPGAEVRQRHLTAAETSEIRRIVKKWWRGLLVGVPLSFALVWKWSNGVVEAWHETIGDAGQSIPWVLAGAVALLLLAFGSYLLWVLERDAKLGLLIIVLMKPTNDGSGIVERLPASRLVWTVNGAPASWRGRALRDGEDDPAGG
ncbi:MAG: hypothetical protein WCF10_18905 [Polyangiales bacterium]